MEVSWLSIMNMLNGTNSTVIIGAAWSIYAHLIPTQWSVFGPFFYGHTSLSTLYKELLIDDNTGLVDGFNRVEDLMFNRFMINLYAKAWDGALLTPHLTSRAIYRIFRL